MNESSTNDIRISVILPVYNVASYIGGCIGSLKAQKIDGLEFIFVDDCSADGSMELVHAFAQTDSRVRIIRLPHNQGPGAARNAGIEVARGEYFSFVDPDDWIDENFYRFLYAKAVETHCDIIKGKTVSVVDQEEKRNPWWEGMNQRMQKKLARGIPLFCAGMYDHFSALYSARLFQDGTVRYGSSRMGEDLTLMLKACFQTESIAFEDKAVYHYRIDREDSATNLFSEKRLYRKLDSLVEMIDFLRERDPEHFCYVYSANRVQSIVKDQCTFIALSPQGDSAGDEFTEKLLAVIRRMPDYRKLAGFSGELYALLEYGYPIPVRHSDPERFEFDRIRRWTALLKENHAARHRCAGGFITAILQTTLAVFSKPKQRQDFRRVLREQCRQLSPGYRLWVHILTPFVVVKKVLDIPLRIRDRYYGTRWKNRTR